MKSAKLCINPGTVNKRAAWKWNLNLCFDSYYVFIFQPQFGASLQILKVEIGGDSQSTGEILFLIYKSPEYNLFAVRYLVHVFFSDFNASNHTYSEKLLNLHY